MADRAYDNAIARRDQLARDINDGQQRLEAFRTELRAVDLFLSQWRLFSNCGTTALADGGLDSIISNERLPPSTETLRTALRRAVGNSKKEEVAEAARKIIRDHNRPLTRSELYPLLIERGMVIQGSDPEMVLSTMLWRMNKSVTRLKGGGYWPAEVPYPDAGYSPGDESASLLDVPIEKMRRPSDADVALMNAMEDGDSEEVDR